MCDDDPTLAAPVTTSTAAVASSNGSATAVLSPKAVADAAVEARQVRALDGRATGRKAAVAPVEAAPPVPLGRLRTVLGDLREGRHRIDLRIHEDALVVDRVAGTDPVLVGRIAGTLVLGPIGLLLGDMVGRRRAHSARRRRITAPGLVDSGERLPLDQLVAVTVQRLPWGGTVRIGAGGTGGRTLRFSKRDLDANDVAGQLQAVTSRRFSMVSVPSGAQLGYRVAKVVLALAVLAMIVVPVRMFVFPPAAPGDELPAAARNGLRDACPTWRAAPLGGPALAAAAIQIRPSLEAAAAAGPEFASLGGDLDVVEAFAPKAGSAGASLTEAAAFSAAVDRIDAACARVSE